MLYVEFANFAEHSHIGGQKRSKYTRSALKGASADLNE